jgi:hypothetical protein
MKYYYQKHLASRIVSGSSQTTFILDALDECNEKTELVDAIHRLVNTSSRIKVLIASRREEDIKYRMGRKANIGMSATNNHDDISTFLSGVIEGDAKSRRIPRPA